MKLLFKQALKSLFSNKIFTIIIMLIIFLCGGTYTLFQSTSSSFKSSYNELVEKGNLNNALVKQNYILNGSFKLTVNPDPSNLANPDSLFKNGNIWSTQLVFTPSSPLSDNDYYNWQQSTNWQAPKIVITSTVGQSDVEARKALINLVQNTIQADSNFINNSVISGKSINFSNAIDAIYKNKLSTTNVKSFSVSLKQSAYKIVTSDAIDYANDYSDAKDVNYNKNPHNVNKLTMYDGTNLFTQDLTNNQMTEELKYQARFLHIPFIPTKINKTKGFKWSITDPSGTSTVSVIDPSSYQAVVSPAYANSNNKISLDPQEVLNLYKDGTINLLENQSTDPDDIQKRNELKRQYAQNLVWVDATPYFIIGIGTTPDFAFPIIDSALPIPDVHHQAIVFVNKRGYERMHDAERTAPTENYIALKFAQNLNKKDQEAIKLQISSIAREGNSAPAAASYQKNIPKMTWPLNIPIVTNYDFTNDSILLEGQRVVFLKKLSSTIRWLSIMTTTLLILFVSAIVLLVFSALIALKRKTMATLLSLGYSKLKIITSFAIVSLLLGALPSMIGYVTGHFAQYTFINIFTDYWTIPVYGKLFSWISLIIIIIIPVLMLFVFVLLVGLWELRHNITQMLNGNISKHNFAPSILNKLQYVGIKSKYSIALFINNFWQLLLISLTAIIATSTLLIEFSTIGRAEYAFNATSALTNYTYKVNLYTPTTYGGTYSLTTLDNLDKLPLKPTYDPKSQTNFNKVHWHIPSVFDVNYATTSSILSPTTTSNDLKEAAYYLKNKLQTKALLDIPLANSKINPWDIAQKLMPDNQRNIANENYNTFIGKNPPSILDKTNTIINEDYLKYFKSRISALAPKEIYPYIITYKNVLINPNDETYSYINTSTTIEGVLHTYNITGYKPNTKYLNIPNNLTQKLMNHENDNSKPILINKYISNELDIDVGSQITMNVNNNVNRFQDPTPHKQKFTVQGILNTFDDQGIYTLQSVANSVTGLAGFNGVFTKKHNPLILNSLPLYSPSGLYLATDTISGDWETVLKKIIKQKNILKDITINNAPEFYKKYTQTPLVSVFNSIIWKSISEYTFKNISNLSSNLLLIIQIISIWLSILFTIIVSVLFIDSNKRKIATLWSLGYRKKEVFKIYISTFIFPAILTLAIATPISLGIVAAMRIFIMHFGHILIPFALLWWMPIIALSIIGLIFILAIAISILRLRGNVALVAFKEE